MRWMLLDERIISSNSKKRDVELDLILIQLKAADMFLYIT